MTTAARGSQDFSDGRDAYESYRRYCAGRGVAPTPYEDFITHLADEIHARVVTLPRAAVTPHLFERLLRESPGKPLIIRNGGRRDFIYGLTLNG